MRKVAAAAFAIAFLVAGSISAEGKTKHAPAIDMTADAVEIDAQAKTAVLHGHVKLSHDDFKVSCERVEVRYDDGAKVSSAKATGGVVAEAKGVKAEAPEATLDLATRTIALSGGVKVTQNDAWLTAEKATLAIDTGRIALTKVSGSLPIPSK